MTNAQLNLLDSIEKLAGSMRGKTMRAAAEFVLTHDNRPILETGCYRGIPGDGNSTLILGMLAAHMNTWLMSVELNPEHITVAMDHTKGLQANIEWLPGDSVDILSRIQAKPVLAYLDSFDHDDKNPGPCQRHQLAELGAIYGKLIPPCAVLLDDNVKETGGKTALAKAFLEERGWKKVMEDYQVLFVRE